MAMSITYAQLMAYIETQKSADGSFTAAALNNITNYILKNGLAVTINTRKSQNGGAF